MAWGVNPSLGEFTSISSRFARDVAQACKGPG